MFKFGHVANLLHDNFMINVNDKEYLSYLDSIESFLKSDRGYQFTGESFSRTIADVLLSSRS